MYLTFRSESFHELTVIDFTGSMSVKNIENCVQLRASRGKFCNNTSTAIINLLLLVCVSLTIIGQPRNSVLIRRV